LWWASLYRRGAFMDLGWVRVNIEEGAVAGGRNEVLVQHARANEPEALFGMAARPVAG
jgi:hypothetical protein